MTLDGTAFVTFSSLNFTWIDDFHNVNLNGFPLPAGETNTVTFWKPPSFKTFYYLKSYAPGDLIPVTFAGYAFVNSTAVPLGCIEFSLIVPNYKRWNSTESTTTQKYSFAEKMFDSIKNEM